MTDGHHKPLHPIANTVIANLETADGRQYLLTQSGGERVVAALRALFDSHELRSAVLSLVSIAKSLDDRGSSVAADQLLMIAGTATSALRALGATAAKLADDIGELTKAKFARFSNGAPRPRAAPRIDDSAAPGTVTVAAFAAYRPRRA